MTNYIVVLERFSHNGKDFQTEYRYTRWMVIREVIKTATAIICITCDFIIMKSILQAQKFKKLKYFHIYNFCALHLYCCLNNSYIVFLDYIHTSRTYDEEQEDYGLYNILRKLEDGILVTIFFGNLLLVFDYFLKIISTKLYLSYTSVNFIFKYIFYVSLAMLALTYIILSKRPTNHLKILNTLYSAIVILTVISYLISCIKKSKCKSYFTLFITTIFLFCWLPYLALQNTQEHIKSEHFIIGYFCAECLIYSTSLFIMICFAFVRKEVSSVVIDYINCCEI